MPPVLMPPWLRYLVVLVGLALISFEAVGRPGEPRWSLLVVYTGMIGVTSLLGLDRRGQAPPAPPAHPPPPPAPAQEETSS